jgi:hypothetical protein
MSVVSGYSANRINNVINKALSEPRKQTSQKLIIFAVVLSGVAALLGIACIYLLVNMQDILIALGKVISDLSAGTPIPLAFGLSIKRFKKWLL